MVAWFIPIIASAAASAAANKAGSKKGSGNAASGDNSPALAAQMQLASAMMQEQQPLRQQLLGRGWEASSGNLDTGPIGQAIRANAAQQFGQAQRGVMESVPMGGARTRALTNLQAARSGQILNQLAQAQESELQRATGLVGGVPAQTLGAYGQIGGIQAQAAQAAQAQQASAKSGMGRGVGTMLAGGQQGSSPIGGSSKKGQTSMVGPNAGNQGMEVT